MVDFANILFAGPCNRHCPWCIGKQLPDRVNVNNLDAWPLRGLDRFVAVVNEHRVPHIVLTGTVSDPQLYRHEAPLLALLRERLHRGARLSVHTNGVLALSKMHVFNQYDRACISLPSFAPDTYAKLTGSHRVPDLAQVVRRATIPVKVSCVLTEDNVGEVEQFLAECHRIGVRRVVFRQCFGERRRWNILGNLPVVRTFAGNPVKSYRGVEVTLWDFDQSTCQSVNLFADGTLGTSYRLTDTPQLLEPPVVERNCAPRGLAKPPSRQAASWTSRLAAQLSARR